MAGGLIAISIIMRKLSENPVKQFLGQGSEILARFSYNFTNTFFEIMYCCWVSFNKLKWCSLISKP